MYIKWRSISLEKGEETLKYEGRVGEGEKDKRIMGFPKGKLT
jgi:hypothetical protein